MERQTFFYLSEENCELLGVKEVYCVGAFYEGDIVTLNVGGNVIRRRAHYNRQYGVYVMIKGRAFSNYEFE